ncbi:MAG: IS630 family transposase, partial [Thermaerobacter sp.]|nr:IS630 family transposase [Thermaerobacter sp.]
VLDNARYQRHASVMAEAERLAMTWLWLPTYSLHRNLIARLGTLVKPDCLHGRYYPKFGPFKQAISDCLADTSRHQAQLNTLLTLKFQVFKPAA